MSMSKRAYEEFLETLPEADYKSFYEAQEIPPEYTNEELEDMANWFQDNFDVEIK